MHSRPGPQLWGRGGPNKNWYVLGVDLEELMGSLKYSTSAQLVLSLSRFPLAFENKLALPILHALDGGSGRRLVGGIGFPSPFSFLVFGWVGCSLLPLPLLVWVGCQVTRGPYRGHNLRTDMSMT